MRSSNNNSNCVARPRRPWRWPADEQTASICSGQRRGGRRSDGQQVAGRNGRADCGPLELAHWPAGQPANGPNGAEACAGRRSGVRKTGGRRDFANHLLLLSMSKSMSSPERRSSRMELGSARKSAPKVITVGGCRSDGGPARAGRTGGRPERALAGRKLSLQGPSGACQGPKRSYGPGCQLAD